MPVGTIGILRTFMFACVLKCKCKNKLIVRLKGEGEQLINLRDFLNVFLGFYFCTSTKNRHCQYGVKINKIIVFVLQVIV